MRPTRLAAVVLASTGLTLIGAAGTAHADTTPTTVANGGTTTPPTTAGPTGDGTVLTPDASGTYTVTLPGVGTLTFQVDATTGAVSNVVATVAPDAPTTVVAGTPKLTHDGVSVSFTDSATGTVKVIRAEVDTEHGATVVKVEDDGAEQSGADDGNADESGHDGQDGQAQDGQGGDQAQAGSDLHRQDGAHADAGRSSGHRNDRGATSSTASTTSRTASTPTTEAQSHQSTTSGGDRSGSGGDHAGSGGDSGSSGGSDGSGD